MTRLVGKWSGAWQIAAVYVGTVVGAGFATGKEIVEFFTQYGEFGTVGIVVSGGLFTWMGTRMMMMARRIGAVSYKELNDYVFGRAMSPLMTILMTLMVIGVTSVMVAGAGAVFEEQLGLPKQVGMFVTLLLSFIVMLYDIKGLFSVNVFIVPMMVLFSFAVLGKMLLSEKWCGTGTVMPDYSLKAFLSPFSYAAFNLAMAQTVLVPLSQEAADEQTVKRGATLGGILLTMILLSSHFVLLSFPHLLRYDIPMAEVIHTFFSLLYWLYIVVIYGEIFTSIIGGIFGLQRQFRSMFRVSNVLFLFVLFLIFYVISSFQYSFLLSLLYPLFGYMSFLMMILLVFRKLPK
ncbi:YkvI family membrane protein [Thermaerobacillus caldiproteolyticus]|uniref:YkvI family membrane protein n=1 Tax=Thermaerobacillus caldiproteolyticus TaxID=247480 RepID=UPI00188CED08|nr:hypothetical protein [Anoxybacillus caldiproteolyticus]QPA31826.1 hypothetical protein ISX45_02120 [Anoxybacillus caldiproteolyticus]